MMDTFKVQNKTHDITPCPYVHYAHGGNAIDKFMSKLTLQCVLVASSKLYTTDRITQEKKAKRAKSNGIRRICCSLISNNRII